MRTQRTRSPKQEQRQYREHRQHGKYAKVNPCYICGKSAGVDYYSHEGTDCVINDELLVLCLSCVKATQSMTGPQAVEWARQNFPQTFGTYGKG